MIEILLNLKCIDNLSIKDNSCLLVDGTLTECERPKPNTVDYYCRKKNYSIKSQVIVDSVSSKVCSVCCTFGSMHDFELFKNWYACSKVDRGSWFIADSGYQGISKVHSGSLSILKKPINGFLSSNDVKFNRHLSKFRVKNEHVIGKLKNFKCVCGKFRHCKLILQWFCSLITVVSSLYNFMIDGL